MIEFLDLCCVLSDTDLIRLFENIHYGDAAIVIIDGTKHVLDRLSAISHMLCEMDDRNILVPIEWRLKYGKG